MVVREKPILFDIPAPMKEKGELTIEDFKKEFEVLKKAAEVFSKLRSKYEFELSGERDNLEI